MPINTINFALASALLLMPPHYSVEQYQSYQKALEISTAEDIGHIAQRILIADGIIEMFYRLAYLDTRLFDAFPSDELLDRFKVTQKILKELSLFSEHNLGFAENLERFTKNFNKLYRLYEGYRS